jgi:hypothetical protein
MVLDETTDPWYGWAGTAVTITGRDIQATGATFTASVDGAEAEIVQIADDHITIRIPRSATNGAITISRVLPYQSITQSIPFHLVRSPYVVNAFEIMTSRLELLSQRTYSSSTAAEATDTGRSVIMLQHSRVSSGLRQRSFCDDMPGGDTLLVCNHTGWYGIDAEGTYYDHTDDGSRMVAVVDSERGVIRSMRIENNWWTNTQRGALGGALEQGGWMLELRDLPYTRAADGSFHVALDGSGFRDRIVDYRRSESQQSHDTTAWRSLVSSSLQLIVPDTATVSITLSYRETWAD